MPSDTPDSVARGFLFADLRGYSRWVESHGDQAAARLLRRYRDLVRAAVAQFDGAEIRTEGDSFYVAFRSPSAAIRCGLQILDDAVSPVGGEPIPVGIGVHAGETVPLDEGYVGSVVNIAARICAEANAGELLVSDVVRGLTRTYLDVRFIPRGRRRLKGIAEPMRVFRVARGPLGFERGEKRSTPDRGRMMGIAAGVTLLVALIAAVSLIAGRPGATAPSAPGLASAGSSFPSSASAVADATSSEFPDGREAALLARLPADVRRHCRPTDPDAIPLHRPDTFDETAAVLPRLPLELLAGVECPLGGPTAPSIVYFFHAARETDLNEAWFQRIAATVPLGDCEEPDTRIGHGRWSIGSVTGRLMCSDHGSRAVIAWTYDEQAIWAEARRNDDDLDALRRWWREHRLIGTPAT